MSANFVFVDEAHFIDEEVIQNGPLAQLAMNAYIVLASTPPRGKSGIQNIIDGRLPNGKRVCLTLDYEFECPTCKEIRKELEEYMCPHRMHWRPPQQTMERIMIAKACFGKSSQAFGAEYMATEMKGGNIFVPEEYIEMLADSEPIHNCSPPQYVYVSYDPAGGKLKPKDMVGSEYAVIIGFTQKEQFIVKNMCYVFIYYVSVSANLILFTTGLSASSPACFGCASRCLMPVERSVGLICAYSSIFFHGSSSIHCFVHSTAKSRGVMWPQ